MATPQPEAPQAGSWLNIGQLRASLKKYGRTGLVTYLTLSTCVTCGFYVAIENAVDVKGLLGIKDDPEKEKSWFEQMFVGKAANLALAVACSKMMVPIKLPVALALTPYVKRVEEHVLRNYAKTR